MVATQFLSTGTQKGEMMGIPATGRRASWTGIVIDRVANGKIAESWANWDTFGMLQQLRAVKAPK
jgi:predicted ester cyclase